MQDKMNLDSLSSEELSQTTTIELTDSDLEQVSGAVDMQHERLPGWGYGYGYGYGYGGGWWNPGWGYGYGYGRG